MQAWTARALLLVTLGGVGLNSGEGSNMMSTSGVVHQGVFWGFSGGSWAFPSQLVHQLRPCLKQRDAGFDHKTLNSLGPG